jgi:hypothetical protein
MNANVLCNGLDDNFDDHDDGICILAHNIWDVDVDHRSYIAVLVVGVVVFYLYLSDQQMLPW